MDEAPPPYGASSIFPPLDKLNLGDKIGYVAVSSSEHCAYLVRSDGIVERSVRNGKIAQQIVPPDGLKYVGVTAGYHCSYLRRSDGVMCRTKSGGKMDKSGQMNPTPGNPYIDASAGVFASYVALRA